MANENETVEQLCDYLANDGNIADEPISVAMPSLAERIRAAHKSEIEKRNKVIKDLSAICRNLLTKDCVGCVRKSCIHFGKDVLCVEHEDLINEIKDAEDLANE